MDDILENQEFMLLLSKEIGNDWLDLGRFLSVKDDKLDDINSEPFNLKEKAYSIFRKWKEQNKFPKLDDLVIALDKVNRKDLIRKIEGNWLITLANANSDVCEALRKFYLKNHGKVDEIVHKAKTPIDVELLNKFVDLTVVDANNVINVEREYLLQNKLTYQPISLDEVLSKEISLLLVSGIAGIGKTWLLKKCLLDWAKGLRWQDIDLVLYLECRQLNQFQNVSDIDELLNLLFKDVFKSFSISPHHSILFLVDGLDEFFYLNELLNQSSENLSDFPIVNTLANVLNFYKYRCVVAGRSKAISDYRDKINNFKDKLTIKIMGFNEDGINNFIEKNFNKDENQKIKDVFQASYFAKAIASVPFYLTSMCAIITAPSKNVYFSFGCMTELYCSIFLYFLQKHVNKNNEPVYKMMQNQNSRQYILKVCKIAFHLLKEGRVIFYQHEMSKIVDDFDNQDKELVGFIEQIETQLGYHYQFVHLSFMEFCASVHAYVSLSPAEIIRDILKNSGLHRCIPVICGLNNRDRSCFVSFFAEMKNSRKEEGSLLSMICGDPDECFCADPKNTFFIECFFESRATITKQLKKNMKNRSWTAEIYDGSHPLEILQQKYFFENYIQANMKVPRLQVWKKILSSDEKDLIKTCSTNVDSVCFTYPIKIEGWTPKHQIYSIEIDIDRCYVSKVDFECFVTWFRVCSNLTLYLHKDTDFIKDICRSISQCSNLKSLMIEFRGRRFHNIESLEKYNEKEENCFEKTSYKKCKVDF